MAVELYTSLLKIFSSTLLACLQWTLEGYYILDLPDSLGKLGSELRVVSVNYYAGRVYYFVRSNIFLDTAPPDSALKAHQMAERHNGCDFDCVACQNEKREAGWYLVRKGRKVLQ
jgi:hypothetical protein